MKEYIETILHQSVEIAPYKDIQKLPLALRSGYQLSRMIIYGQEALVAEPTEKTHFSALRKQQHQLETYTRLPCVLYLREMNYYSRDMMLKEGIPFVWEGHQIYLPFAGTLVDEQKRKEIRTYNRISFLTQKMLITALYERWQKVTVTKAAQLLGVSKMSITRSFDEMEALNIPYLTVRSRARNITANPDKKVMWEELKPFFRDPVITTYAYKEIPDAVLPMAGMTALAHYSLLDGGEYPVLAVTKRNLADLRLSEDRIALAGEIPGCIIQELGYHILFEDGSAVDPLTVALSISKEELDDPRVSMAVDEMLEEHVW